MKVRGTLTVEDTVLHHTLLCRSISLETFLIDCRVLAMIVRVHLNVARADVSLIALVLNAMIMRLLTIVLTETELNCAIVNRSEAEKTGRNSH